MALVERLINVTFQRGDGKTFAGAGNTLKLSGLRVSTQIAMAGTIVMTCHLRIYGMTLSQMNDLQTMGMAFNIAGIGRNQVTVEAGDADTGLTTVFVGMVMTAFIDMTNAPDVAFDVMANTTGFFQAALAKAGSYKGSSDAATIGQDLANQMGLKFENNNVKVKLSNQYLPGSPMDQAQTLAGAANINFTVDKGVFAIWNRGESRKNGNPTPLISPETGMWGYPIYTNFGLLVRCVFNKDLQFGGLVEIQSSLKPANGTWYIYGLGHDLESNVPRGQWSSTIQCYDIKHKGSVVAASLG